MTNHMLQIPQRDDTFQWKGRWQMNIRITEQGTGYWQINTGITGQRTGYWQINTGITEQRTGYLANKHRNYTAEDRILAIKHLNYRAEYRILADEKNSRTGDRTQNRRTEEQRKRFCLLRTEISKAHILLTQSA